jgi:hypothetical protein
LPLFTANFGFSSRQRTDNIDDMKVFLGIVVVLALVVGVLNYIAPKEFKLEREIVINKPVAEVFNYTKMLNNSTQWNSWMKKDPNMKHNIVGTDGTVGAILNWESDNKEVGHGTQTIKEIVDNQKFGTEITLTDYKMTFDSYFRFEAITDTQTKVIMGMDSTSKFPCNIIGMIMNCKSMISKEFDSSLADLKTVVESQTSTTPVAAPIAE